MFCPLSLLLKSEQPLETVVAYRQGVPVLFSDFRKDTQRQKTLICSKPHADVVLALTDSYDFAVCFMAALHSGRRVVIPANMQKDSLMELQDQGYLLLQERGTTTESDYSSITLADLESDNCKIDLHTSGSTSDPKTVHKTLRQLESEVSELQRLWGARLERSVTLATVSHQHIYGILFKVLWPLSAGRPFVVETLSYWEQLEHHNTHTYCIISSPAHLSRFPDGFSVRGADAPIEVFSSGGPLALAAAQETNVRLKLLPLEVYGSTETGGIAYRRQAQPDTPWQAFSVIEIQSNEGVLCLRSPYLEDDAWYQTNDLVRLEGEGKFHLIGRNDRIVKIEGKRVSLVQIEAHLKAHDWILDAVTLRLDDARNSLACVAALTEEGNAARGELGDFRFGQTLRRSMSGRFDLLSLPRRWRFVDQIPQNSEGKRLHRVLSSLFS